MKLLFVLVAFAMAVSVVEGYSDDEAWRYYKKEHKLDYNIAGDGGKRDAMRKKIFLNKRDEIRKHNSKYEKYYKELNKFSVMTPEERKQYFGADPSKAPTPEFLKSIPVNLQSRQLPSYFDYRDDYCMPKIRDQDTCGSCWAYAAITPLEFSKCNLIDRPVILSEQHLVDCDTSNDGCGGGWYDDAWDYLKSNQNGSARGPLYPYANKQSSTCKFKTTTVGAQVSSYGYVQSNNATAMQLALMEYGPLAVAIAVADSIQDYGGGVYDDPDCDGKTIGHAVTIVGWGSQYDVDYWIVRNSWGTEVGINGYYLFERGVNKCQIERYPAYVKAA